MAFVDKSIGCKDCGQDFVFTAGEQEFYSEKGFENEPQRCKSCRDDRKKRNGNSRNTGSSRKEMFETVCADCGVTTQVPFQPRNDRPVFCRTCFETRK